MFKGCMYFIFGLWSLLEKAMAPHFSNLTWKIPWMEEPGGLQSMGSLRVRHDWATSLSLFTFMHWRRKWQPTLVFLPGESQGRGSLVGCCLWGRTESDTTETMQQQQHVPSIPAFWSISIINGCWILSEAFSASIEIIIWLLFFNLLIGCTTLICKCWRILGIPGIKPT